MFSMDCERCPSRPGHCGGCIVPLLLGEKPQFDALSEESCGYVLDPEVRAAIEVLMELGMVSDIQIVAAHAAA